MFRPGVTVWYNVKSMEATIDFYKEKLGFEPLFHDPASGMAMMNTSTQDCVIGFSEANEVIASTSSTVFEVYDIEESRRVLEHKGVTFIGETETVPGMAKLATFIDPDGHSLMLSEVLSPL
ncbi:VOC family protein [Paenibacillus mendelii]|uniref:VOC family protein n=1 Tax=Paenibacillus mendelii TaxID=206163 RepID=A0ABV6JKT3_9BACL|nr:VOC family protein [Paenibacillus mendelii]MCQ6563057.1 VOC family protein [Paenibacillus mendelii]